MMRLFTLSLMLLGAAASAGPKSVITQPTTVSGFTGAGQWTAEAKTERAFRAAFANYANVSISDVSVENLVTKEGGGITFDVVAKTTQAKKAAVQATLDGTNFDSGMTARLNRALEQTANTHTYTSTSSSVKSDTKAPTKSPRPAPLPRKKYTPSASVKTLHGYTGSPPTFDFDKTKDNVFRVVATAVALAVLALLSYYMFLLLQRCTGCCPTFLRCCYKASCGKKNHGMIKIFQVFLFVLVGGLMCGSIKGRDSFHKGMDSVSAALGELADMFESMDGAATAMETTQVKGFRDGITFLQSTEFSQAAKDNPDAASNSLACVACPYPGILPAPATTTAQAKGVWDDEVHAKITGYASALSGPVDGLETAANAMTSLMDGQAATMREAADTFADPKVKDYVTMAVAATVAFAVFVSIFGVVGTLCLSNNSKKHGKCCNLSTLLIAICNFFAFIFLLLIIIFIAVELGISASFSDMCFNPPNENILQTMKEENVLKSLGANATKQLEYYMTCPPEANNDMEDQLNTALAQLTNLGTELDKLTTCDIAQIAAVIPQVVESTRVLVRNLGCLRIMNIFKLFTEDALCTHLVDGLYFLWTVQAASGVMLLAALFSMALVQQAFYEDSGAAVAPEKPVGDDIEQGIEMQPQQGAILAVPEQQGVVMAEPAPLESAPQQEEAGQQPAGEQVAAEQSEPASATAVADPSVQDEATAAMQDANAGSENEG